MFNLNLFKLFKSIKNNVMTLSSVFKNFIVILLMIYFLYNLFLLWVMNSFVKVYTVCELIEQQIGENFFISDINFSMSDLNATWEDELWFLPGEAFFPITFDIFYYDNMPSPGWDGTDRPFVHKEDPVYNEEWEVIINYQADNASRTYKDYF